MTNHKRYQELASKWLNNTITEAEKAEFMAWYNAFEDDELSIPESFVPGEDALKERIFSRVKSNVQFERKNRNNWAKAKRATAIAAVLFLAITVGFYVLKTPRQPADQPLLVQQDVQPGGDRALLTLADGQVIVLDSLTIGEIAEVSGMKITKTAEGQILYEASSASAGKSDHSVNTISTPRGGQYQVVLPDGSKVWLNAASSLSYPTRFDSNARKVTLLAGEAYFEVKRADRGKGKIPFIVEMAGQQVEVLGTQFNISDYDDEDGIKTTLVEGSISVKNNNGSAERILRPGEQSHISGTDGQFQVSRVDTAPFTAWKDGFFYFSDADIYTVMRQMSRWYDIEVVYKITQSNDLYVGKIPRNVSLSTALNVLKTAGVNFKVTGRQLMIMPEKETE